jgi:SAM-dependent methyltransferase
MFEADVAKLYDTGAIEEWDRLDVRRTEFGVTCCALDEYLPPPPARILDVGSGPGRYAIHLAQRGADPTEIRPFMERLGLQTIQMVGCEGVVAEVEEKINELPEEEFARWVALNYRLGRKDELLAASAHILHIGRSP